MSSLVQTFMELCRIDSPTGSEDQIAAYIQEALKDYAVVKQDSFGNVYARIEGIGDPLFFSSHMDTVEPGRGIVPRVQNGYVVSTGDTILGADNKAAVAVMISLACAHNAKKHRPLDLVFTRSEEIGNYGAIEFDYSLLRATKGYCMDSSNPVGTIITASPYYERFDITISGIEAHASRPQEAQNVISPLTGILSGIPRGKVGEHTIVNVGVVHVGHVRNTIPGTCRIEAEIRSYEESELLFHKKHICSLLDMNNYRFDGSITYEFVRENPGYLLATDEQEVFIQQTEEGVRSCGLAPVRLESWGVSDANIFNEHDLICINLGDGSEFSHSVNERISVDELHTLETLARKLSAV